MGKVQTTGQTSLADWWTRVCCVHGVRVGGIKAVRRQDRNLIAIADRPNGRVVEVDCDVYDGIKGKRGDATAVLISSNASDERLLFRQRVASVAVILTRVPPT